MLLSCTYIILFYILCFNFIVLVCVFMFRPHQLTWKINFIQDWDNLQVVFKGQPHVGKRLGLHALAGIYHQQRPFT